MRHAPTQLARPALAALLAVCVSVCCCHAHTFVDELSGPKPERSSTCGASCCSQATPDGTPDGAPATPEKSCKSCCIKGTGLKDAKITVPSLELVAVADLTAGPIVTSPPSLPLGRRDDACRRRVEPATLLHLHCALIV